MSLRESYFPQLALPLAASFPRNRVSYPSSSSTTSCGLSVDPNPAHASPPARPMAMPSERRTRPTRRCNVDLSDLSTAEFAFFDGHGPMLEAKLDSERLGFDVFYELLDGRRNGAGIGGIDLPRCGP